MSIRAMLGRIAAVFVKEWRQMRRDRLTFATMVGVPVIQLIMFGYAVNATPKHLPTAVVVQDSAVAADDVRSILETTTYFKVVRVSPDEAQARRLLTTGKVDFVVRIPPNFMRDLNNGARPHVFVDADGADPMAIASPLAALSAVPAAMAKEDPSGQFNNDVPPFDVVVHRLYNPDGLTVINIVPGLIGLVLTQTMVLITALAITRETERGTFEGLLGMGLRPVEIMLGKMLPYVAVGYAQLVLVLVAARFLFHVPMLGSYLGLTGASTLFILANLAVGFAISTLCRSQFQAMQATFFFFLPSVMLTGFMFPFQGMPRWAQWIGEALPNTHFLRIARGVMLKGNSLADVGGDLWALAALTIAACALAMLTYRRTLD
ncbi:MAG: ABC transporter permease [Caulobacterales bacterium]